LVTALQKWLEGRLSSRERETRAPVRDGDSIKPPPKQLHNPYKANKSKQGFMRCIDQVDDVSRNNAQQTKTNYIIIKKRETVMLEKLNNQTTDKNKQKT
jgi:hypothetical protein